MEMAKRPRSQTARFEMRCSDDELALWRRAAEKHGLPLAAYVRICMNRGPILSRKAQVDPAMLRQLAAIGNNLNQLTRWANANKGGLEARLVLAELQHIRQELSALRDGSPHVD